ncbi:MAG: substrate-binding domain-containing protein [Magnetospirillum sp.]|nr:substrate-binding domain-containing protein [Magnetospirillum sp.]
MGRLSRRLMAALILLCLGDAVAQAETLRVGGTGSGLAVARALFEAFRTGYPDVELWMPESVGTRGAVLGLEGGKLDVGVLQRPLRADEVPGGRAQELCRTPFVFFVASARTDLQFSRDTLGELYAGTLASNLRPVLRPEQESSTIQLLGYFPELKAPVEAARQRRGRVLALTDQDAMDAAEQSPSLVGVGALAPLVAERRRLIPVPLDGVAPSIDSLAAGHYPYASQLLLAVGPSPSAAATAFLDFVAGPAAAAMLRANGCLPGGQASR